MRQRSRYEVWYGRDEPPAETRELRAGALSAQLEGIDLRYVRLGGVEVVRRLFVAVRDAAWGTIPPEVSGLEVEEGADSFRVSFDARHEAGELRFRWHGELTAAAGELDCRLEGVAESDFDYNRIGFCVLHPREHAGAPYRARTPDGELTGALPDTIGPQRSEGGKLYPLFPSYERLELDLGGGLVARFDFEGDLFEMEDQRNWTDASFKTYSTPITLGWPHRAQAGQEIRQRVRLTFTGAAPAATDAGGPVRLEVAAPVGPLPAVGLCVASHGERLTAREAERLRALRLDHLRAELRLGGGWEADLARAVEESGALGVPLELALLLGDEPEAELDRLAAETAPVARVLVFKDGETCTDTRWVRVARERLAAAFPGAPFAGGSNLNFTELNREPPEPDGLDAVVYSTSATVHATDDTSVRETPSAQADAVRSARALAPGKQVVVGPVTIRPRVWPFGELDGYRGLPFQVDPRQCSLFGAAWTVASAKHLAEAGADAVTFFETTGWRGVLETEAGSPAPEAFLSQPGAVFPLYHVLADLAEWKDGEVVSVRSTEPLSVEALAVRRGDRLHLLVANLTPRPQRVLAREGSLRRLDETTFAEACERPEEFRERREDGGPELELAPYAVVRVDA